MKSRPEADSKPTQQGTLDTQTPDPAPAAPGVETVPETDSGPSTTTTATAPAPPTTPPVAAPAPWWKKLLHSERGVAIAVILATSLFLIPGAGSYGLFDPWETHYGEVARNMWESKDWISPWWGSYWPEGSVCMSDQDCPADHVCSPIRHEYLSKPATCRPKNLTREGAYFFSKPALSMWMMATGISIFGLNEIGVRFFFLLSAVFCLTGVFLVIRRFFSQRAALMATLVLGTSPFFFMQARQAVTDTPYVNFLTAGLCFFLLGIFGKTPEPATAAPEPGSAPGAPDQPPGEAPPRTAPLALGIFLVAFLGFVIPQILTISFSLKAFMRLGGQWRLMVGPVHGILYTVAVVLFLFTLRKPKARTLESVYLYTFYLCVSLATLAKGLLGVAIPGAVVLLYIIFSSEWSIIRRARLIQGALIFAAGAVPWYASMISRHPRAFYNRFFVHDHFKRLATGVHQTDSGQFDHFVLWLGLGFFPWVGFIPSALARLTSSFRKGLKTPADRVRLFLFIWFAMTFALFTLSSTKFHHYIFPAVPPLAMLTGLFLDDLLKGKVRLPGLVVASALAIGGIVGFNLADDPQRLVNLFTYKYDRTWPPEVDFHVILPVITAITLLPLGLWLIGWFVRKLKSSEEVPSPNNWLMTKSAGLMAVTAILFALWGMNGYLPAISHTWSQKEIFQAYHEACTPVTPAQFNKQGRPVCKEDLISYKLNWRGETFYSENTVLPMLKDADFDYYLKNNPSEPFFALTEYRRLSGQLKAKIKDERKHQIKRVWSGNTKFVLVKVGE